MTKEQEAITYFESVKKRLEDFREIYPSPDTVGYQATTKEISFYDMAISALSENKGEWIKIQSGDKDFPESIVCSKCKNENSHLDFNEHGEPIGKVFVTSKFCPNCGAKMKGGE